MVKTEELFLKLLRFVSVTPEDGGAFAFTKKSTSVTLK